MGIRTCSLFVMVFRDNFVQIDFRTPRHKIVTVMREPVDPFDVRGGHIGAIYLFCLQNYIDLTCEPR